jgi:pimeloyl-ACP methyl ester carboxylesterase
MASLPPGTRTVHVPHLGGIDVGCVTTEQYDPDKPTCVLVNAFTMAAAMYKAQLDDPKLAVGMNLLAVEPLGHGETQILKSRQWTTWDSAIMINQVLDSLNITQCFILGSSQGGWIATRAVLLRPERVRLAHESPSPSRARSLF